MKTRLAGLAALLCACGTPATMIFDGTAPVVSTDAGAVQPSDAGTDAGLDASVDASVDAGPLCRSSGVCALTWVDAGSYPVVVDHHTTAILTDDAGISHLYVFGGVSEPAQDIYPEVRRALIDPVGGGLGPWEDDTPLATPLGYHAMAERNGRVYLVGGISKDAMGEYASARVYIGQQGTDGGLQWTRGSNLTQIFRHATACIIGDRLFMVGGLGSGDAIDVVMAATIAPSGITGPWTAMASLPEPRTHHSAAVHGGHIYILGGMTTADGYLDSILRSEHDTTGALTAWTNIGTLPNASWTSAAVVLDDWLFLVGGGAGNNSSAVALDSVRRAHFEADGGLGPFEDVSMSLPVGRSHVHQTPFLNGRLYSVGGRRFLGGLNGNTIDQVFIGTFH